MCVVCVCISMVVWGVCVCVCVCVCDLINPCPIVAVVNLTLSITCQEMLLSLDFIGKKSNRKGR